MGIPNKQTESTKMSSKTYRAGYNNKKTTRTLSKIQQTLLEEERRDKLRRSASLFQKKQPAKKRKYKKRNTQQTNNYEKQTQDNKREKRQTQESNKGSINFRINPYYRKMSWVEMDEIPEEEFQDFWVIDSDDEE